ncbi:MAG: hypothetical protein JSS02_05305 [Planctomycetes bacterium]|nr:hypothetical protein [Planctomycetota bacterium]
MIKVAFQHWQYTFTAEILRRYGSRHYSRLEAGRVLLDNARGVSKLSTECELQFSPDQILCANEAFPGLAIADPLADLEIWDEWKNGARAFPYPGRYSKLGITSLDDNDNTTIHSSIEVIGEIMAGIFSQAGICPWVLVRVVQNWPDLIFAQPNGMYSFVESQAFSADPDPYQRSEGLLSRVSEQLLRQDLVDAMQQLNSDPCGTVWNVFTRVLSVSPTQFEVTFLEINAPEELKQVRGLGPIPGVVLEGLARRAVDQAVTKLSADQIERFEKNPKMAIDQTVALLRNNVDSEIPELLAEARRGQSGAGDFDALQFEIHQLLNRIENDSSRASVGRFNIGRRLSSAKAAAASGELAFLREVHDRALFLADLPWESRRQITTDWQPAWEGANRQYGQVDNVPLWRCGGALFALGPAQLAGRHVGNSVCG